MVHQNYMTNKQNDLVHNLRIKLLRNGYPKIYMVSKEELEAVEQYLTEWLLSINEDPILACGKYGLYFKGCELVLET